MGKEQEKKILHLYPTMRCPLNCDYCYVNDVNRNQSELSMEVYNKLLREAKEIGVSVVDIAGGEPLAFQNIIPLLRACKKNNQLTKLVSNGLYLSEYMNQVKQEEYLIDELHLSFDSDIPEIHDKIRKHKGLHNIVCQAIHEYIKKQYGKVIINYVLQKDSFTRLEQILEFVYQLEADGIDIQYVTNVGEKTKQNEFALSLLEIKNSLLHMIHWYNKKKDNNFRLLVSLPNYIYPLLKADQEIMENLLNINVIFAHGLFGKNYFADTIIVRYDGWVTGSTSMINNQDWMIGNIESESIKEIWEHKRKSVNDRIKQRSKNLQQNGVCKNCAAARVCHGGDPVEFAQLENVCLVKNELESLLNHNGYFNEII